MITYASAFSWQAEVSDERIQRVVCGSMGVSKLNACVALAFASKEGGMEGGGAGLALLDLTTSQLSSHASADSVAAVARFEPRSNMLLLGGSDG